ncbi:holo-ACP synthase [Candidatus Bipolaricaulota bacterium]|nr:holo-ACP synthase [Candidatus Bipolaricaulota bacterium]
MLSLGIDLVEVARIRDLVERRGERFLTRLFSPGEIEYSLRARPPLSYQRLAARLAAKEAFIKALGRPVPFRELEVVSTGRKPSLRWQGNCYPLSLSHTDSFAVAMVVLPEGLIPPRTGP